MPTKGKGFKVAGEGKKRKTKGGAIPIGTLVKAAEAGIQVGKLIDREIKSKKAHDAKMKAKKTAEFNRAYAAASPEMKASLQRMADPRKQFAFMNAQALAASRGNGMVATRKRK